MMLVGLAAPMRCGKDTIADILVANYNFLKFSFSDALYEEVQKAFGLLAPALLRDAETKEETTPRLALEHCTDPAFVELATKLIDGKYRQAAGGTGSLLLAPWKEPLSPRTVLQWWGTEYRRAQDPEYWIKKADFFVAAFLANPDLRGDVAGLVNTSVRFENELAFIDKWNGIVWHIYRREAEAKHLDTYVSERRLPVRPRDKELHNNSSLEKLATGVSLLLGPTRELVLED